MPNTFATLRIAPGNILAVLLSVLLKTGGADGKKFRDAGGDKCLAEG